MLLSLFYIIGLFILIFSFSNLINFIKFNKIRIWAKTFRKVTKKEVDRVDFKSNEQYNIFIIYSLFSFIEIVWILLGLATTSFNHWVIFLSILSLNLIMRSLYKYSNLVLTNFFGSIYSIIKFTSILFLILNYFHFHQDILVFFR
jgi:hypothetical protein